MQDEQQASVDRQAERRIRKCLRAADCAAIVLFDPVHIRYATGTRNMQVWWYREDEEWDAYDGVFEESIVVCIECYVGAVSGREGVKLEQPVWLSPEGPVVLSEYPFELDYL